jgi:hypothetical protein
MQEALIKLLIVRLLEQEADKGQRQQILQVLDLY